MTGLGTMRITSVAFLGATLCQAPSAMSQEARPAAAEAKPPPSENGAPEPSAEPTQPQAESAAPQGKVSEVEARNLAEPGVEQSTDDGDGWTRVAIIGDASVWTSQVGTSTDTAFGGGLAWSTYRTSASLLIRNGQLGEIKNDEARNFGAFLLTPTSAKLSAAFQASYFPWAWPWSPKRSRLGLTYYLQAGGAKWSVIDGDTTVDSRNVVALATGLGLATHVGPSSCSGILNCWGVQGSISLAARGLLGDGGQDKSFRALALGEDSSPWWFGPELGARINVNDVSIGMSLVVLFAEDKIAGLTGGQLIPTIDVSVPINVALAPDDEPEDESAPAGPGNVEAKARRQLEREESKEQTRPLFFAPP